jgi:hypothetical protein
MNSLLSQHGAPRLTSRTLAGPRACAKCPQDRRVAVQTRTLAVIRCALLVLREAQFDTAVAGVEPAAGDGLAAGEEVHTLFAMGVEVAEQ